MIATSACVSGVLASIMFLNKGMENKLEKLRKRQEKYTSPESESFKKDNEKLEEIKNRLSEISEKVKELKKLAENPLPHWKRESRKT